MDYEKFVNHLPDLYDNWGEETVCPRCDRFHAVLSKVKGMTTPNVLQLLNFAVACMEPEEIYCEVGCFQGATLIGAMLDQPDRLAYAIDNFSEYDPTGVNLLRLRENLDQFGLTEQISFCNQDFETFFLDLRSLETSDRIGVYFYDGAHDYRSQLMGLLLAKPFLADRALIIVDDSNFQAVQQANWDFIATHTQATCLLHLVTKGNGSATFWNGLQIIGWDVTQHFNYSSDLHRQLRHQPIVQAIYDLHFHTP